MVSHFFVENPMQQAHHTPDSSKAVAFFRKASIGLLLSCVLAACSSLPDAPSLQNTQAAYEAHTKSFNARNPHQTIRVKRPDGHGLQVRQFGLEHKAHRATYVLMHGFPDNQHLYDRLIPELAKTHHVVSFDFLGSGASDKPSTHNYQVSSQRLDLDTVIQTLNLERLILVVHDLSGQVGIDWALDHSARVSELVLLNSYYQQMATLKAPDAIEFYSKPGLLRDFARWGANKSASRFKSGLADQLYAFMSTAKARRQFIPVLANSAPAIRPAFFSSVGAGHFR
jgi:pimeloyl-ACP methyl ester carboxylesterase